MEQFWKTKRLDEMSPAEWESLCDGCGKCCLNKLIDDDTDELYYTNAACKLLDSETCSCRQYAERFSVVPACTSITPANIASLTWLPQSCAYIRLFQGRDLPSWHPLRTGDKAAMHAAAMSVRAKTVCETKVRDIEDYIVRWPLNDQD